MESWDGGDRPRDDGEATFDRNGGGSGGWAGQAPSTEWAQRWGSEGKIILGILGIGHRWGIHTNRRETQGAIRPWVQKSYPLGGVWIGGLGDGISCYGIIG